MTVFLTRAVLFFLSDRKFCQPVARADTVAVVVHLENGNVEIFRKGVSLGVAFIGVKGRVRFACGLFGTGATVGVCGSAAEVRFVLCCSHVALALHVYLGSRKPHSSHPARIIMIRWNGCVSRRANPLTLALWALALT